MKLRSRLPALLAIPVAAALQVAVPVAAHGSVASCLPKVYLPFISAGSGYAHVYTVGCDSDTYTYRVEFNTSTGATLSGYTISSAHGNIDATAPLFNTLTNCSGKQVRSFIWINVGGTVKSNQSSLVSC